MFPGYATAEGTAAFAKKHAGLSSGHWRDALELTVSSIGLGSYLGRWDDATDLKYEDAVRRAIGLGCNLIDTAINYRFQRSERALGAGLRKAVEAGEVRREAFLVCTKGGYLSFDGAPPDHPVAWFEQTFVRTGICRPEDLLEESHCMTPAYLRHEIEQSRRNLGLETIDVYYVHNPETQLPVVGPDGFYRRLTDAFRELERAAADGEIRGYGTATWNGYREPPESPGHLSLERVIECARAAGGAGHRFRVVQLPFNLAMPEALLSPTQTLRGRRVSLLEAAEALEIVVVASASLLQAKLIGRMTPELRERFTGLETDAQRAIQFVRSAPGLTTALVGMKESAHVEENFKVASVPPLSEAEFRGLFTS